MDEKQYEDMWNVMRRHDLDLTDDTSSEYECTICENILINACTAPCRCLFCRDCIERYLRNGNSKCPGQSQYCGVEDIDFNSDIRINMLVNKTISKLSVKCPNVGCQSQLKLNVLEDHLRMCENQPEDCPYSILGCGDDKLRNDQMSEHLSMDSHTHAKLLINWIRNSQNETKSMKRDVENLKANNEKLNEQIRVDKENTEKVIHELRKKDDENSMEIHRLNDEICSLKNSNRSIKEDLKKLKDGQQSSRLNSETENKIKEIDDLERRFKLVESKCEEIFDQSEKSYATQIKMDEIADACADLKTEFIGKTNSIEQIREVIDKTVTGEVHWIIDQFSQKMQNARKDKNAKIFSDSFLTQPREFKICLSLWPRFNGDFVGIHFHIMKGPFDDSLRWPFDRDLEFSLINHQTGIAHKSMTIKYSQFPNYSALQKPETEINEQVWICSIPLHELSIKPELCRNNQILIKLSFKPPSIEIRTK